MITDLRAKCQTLCFIVLCPGFMCLTDSSIAGMTCPAAPLGNRAHDISCTASVDASSISLTRNSTELISCNASACNASFRGHKGDVTRNETHLRVSLVIENVQLADEGVLTCHVRNESSKFDKNSTYCFLYVFVPPEAPYCNHATNRTHVHIACTTAKVYPKALCNWTVTSLSGGTPKVKFTTSSNVSGPFFTTTCRASFPHDNQTDYKVTVTLFPATVAGRDMSNGLAVVTLGFDVTSMLRPGSGKSWSSKETALLVVFLMIPAIIATLLVYIFVVKRRLLYTKKDSGLYNDASIKLWMDQATSIPTEPQKNTIKEIVRKPKKDLLKSKVPLNILNAANEEESEPYAKIIKTCKNKMEYTPDSIYNNEMENISDVIYNNGIENTSYLICNNEMVSLETSSTESAARTEQLTDDKTFDTAMEPDKNIVQTTESEELDSRHSDNVGSDKEMCELNDQERPGQAKDQVCEHISELNKGIKTCCG